MSVQYEAHVYRDDRWWMVKIPELAGLTQARRLAEAVEEARDWIATTTEADPDDIDVVITDIQIPGDTEEATRHLLEETVHVRSSAERLEHQARDHQAQAAAVVGDFVAELTAAGIPLRDIGFLLQLTYGRIGQIAAQTQLRRESGAAAPASEPPSPAKNYLPPGLQLQRR